MTYGFRRTPAPPIHNLEQALSMYHDIKPIRGRAEDVRPFAKRSDDNRRLVLNPDGSVACRLYYTDVITFHENKVELQIQGYNSQTTVAFLNDVMGRSGVCFMQFSNKLWIYAKDKSRYDSMSSEDKISPHVEGGYYPMPMHDSTWLERDAEGRYSVLVNPNYSVVHTINRKRANSVRKEYKTFKQYVSNALRLRGGEVRMEEYGEVFGWINKDCPNIPTKLEVREWLRVENADVDGLMRLAKSPEPEDNYKAFLWLVLPLLAYRRVGTVNYVGEEFALRNLDKLILRAHRDVCFDERIVTDGTQSVDRYAAYF